MRAMTLRYSVIALVVLMLLGCAPPDPTRQMSQIAGVWVDKGGLEYSFTADGRCVMPLTTATGQNFYAPGVYQMKDYDFLWSADTIVYDKLHATDPIQVVGKINYDPGHEKISAQFTRPFTRLPFGAMILTRKEPASAGDTAYKEAVIAMQQR